VTDCLFCCIVAGEIPADIVYQDEDVIAIRDIQPQAPTHVLVIPRRHIPTLSDLTADDLDLAGHLTLVAARVAADEGVAESGYRTVVNNRRDANQTVNHIHVHVLGGRAMGWPPG